MTDKEALRIALEALQFALHVGFDESSESQIIKGDKAWQQHVQAITAIKQALATPLQEPVATLFGSLPVYDTTPPAAAVQEGRDWSLLEATQESLREHMSEIKRLKAAQPAPVQPIGEVIGRNEYAGLGQIKHAKTIEWFGEPAPVGTKLYTTPPAQPAVPDAMHHTDMSKTLEYIQGWNACRQATLEMMK
jgi:hypothetical protein